MQRNLKDMVVVITGASAGIGKALAEELAPRGARLVLAARRMERLEELNRKLGAGHLCVRTDVSRTEECAALIERSIGHFGRIDTLVCNAGYGNYRSIGQITPAETHAMFATNFFGTSDCIHFALPHMQKQDQREDGRRGQIMIVSSFVARRGIPFIGVYSGTKAAQLTYAEALRIELKPSRIAVTTVHPIQTETEFGEVAEAGGDMKIAPAPMSQSAALVARKMARAIEKPVLELWPSRPSRWACDLSVLFPRFADFCMNRYRKQVERANPVRPQ